MAFGAVALAAPEQAAIKMIANSVPRDNELGLKGKKSIMQKCVSGS
jgi:hypothetical protein